MMITPADLAMTIAVTGSTGFIGSAVVDELASAGHRVRALRRSAAPDRSSVEEVVSSYGVDDTKALKRLLAGTDALVHAISYTGADQQLQWSTNVEVTRKLCEEAIAHSVRRVVYISTAGVYGTAFASGIDETVQPAPRSQLSRSRREAESIVIDAGGIVLRPQFVLGAGDRWVLSQWSALIMACNAQGVESHARASVINRTGLADVLRSIVTASTVSHQVYNVGASRTVSMAELAETVLRPKDTSSPVHRLAADELLVAADRLGFSRHAVSLVLEESLLDCSRLWSEFSESSHHAPILTADDVAWYRRWLGIED